MLTRREDWPERLAAAVAAARRKPFAWGEHDCLLWTCGVVRDMTGVDWAAEWRGRYNDRKGALRLLRDFAGGGLVETCEKIARDWQLQEVTAAFAQRGDVTLLDTVTGPAIGPCIGDHAVYVAADQLGFVDMVNIKRAWRI